MFHFLKSNNPALAVINLALIILFRVFFVLHPIDISALYHHSEPGAMLLVRIFDISHISMLWLAIAGGVLCFIESLLVNKIINSHKVASRKNYIGGILFVVFCSLVPECMVLGPAQVAVLFLLLLIDRLFDLSRPDKFYSTIFDLGFLSAIAMLFYFPAIYLLILVIIGFLTMRTSTLRGLLMILTGFFAVLLTVFTVYFWYDALPEMMSDIVNAKNRIPLHDIALTHWQIIDLVLIALTGAWILVNIPSILYSSVIQTRKYITILILSGVLSLLGLPLVLNFNLTHLLFLLTSLSILCGVYFVETKITVIAEVLFIVLILSVFAFEYLPLFISI